MHLEPIPIEAFVAEKFRSRQVQRIVETWNVEGEKIVEVLVRHFVDMGFIEVSHVNETVVFESILFQLRTSPEIRGLVMAMRREEAMRRRSRHAE